VFDDLPNIKEIADCATAVTASYDNFAKFPTKKNLYLALIAANALEAIRFYVSFACTFSFLERGMVEGSAKMVKLIARDEAEHLALTQHLIKLLIKDDPEFEKIIADSQEEAKQIFLSAAEQEKAWAVYLFKKGPVLGLNEKMLSDYVDYLLARRMKAVGLGSDNSYRGNHPLPWIEKHFSNTSTQVAPQEVEISSYLSASVNNDMHSMDIGNLWKEDIDL
jgi:ribonucleoside-diphosphate reductase beta chain